MSRLTAAIALACALLSFASIAEARPARVQRTDTITCDQQGCHGVTVIGKTVRGRAGAHVDANGNRLHGDPRPHAWCGWQMRQWFGVSDRSGNRAIWWARYGANAHAPAVGTIVVWRHHVGIITGRSEDGWIVKSGNDGGAIRERELPLRGAVAFRWPNGTALR